MARSKVLSTIATLGIGYFFYTEAVKGTFGPDIKGLLSGNKAQPQPQPQPPNGGSNNGGSNDCPGDGVHPGFRSPVTGECNNYLYQQMFDWQTARRQAGETPHDWEAFRQHVIALGAPDPGDWNPNGLLFYAKG